MIIRPICVGNCPPMKQVGHRKHLNIKQTCFQKWVDELGGRIAASSFSALGRGECGEEIVLTTRKRGAEGREAEEPYIPQLLIWWQLLLL